jgi:hypothetical protein
MITKDKDYHIFQRESKAACEKWHKPYNRNYYEQKQNRRGRF